MSELGYSGKTVVVYGLGKSGLAMAEALAEDGATVLAWDDRAPEEINRLDHVRHLSDIENFTLCAPHNIDFETVSALFKSPGISMEAALVVEAQEAGVPVMGDIDLLYRREKESGAHFLGITGTNGKSTTTALVGHVLRVNGYHVEIGGNLGHPAMAFSSLGAGGVYVLELSSYQLETVRELSLNGAAILNLTPDHLERHKDMANYLKAKRRIFNRQSKDNQRVIGVDSPALVTLARELKGEVPLTTVSTQGEADVYIDEAGRLMDDTTCVAELARLTNIPGRHNWGNVAVAYQLTKPYIGATQFVEALSSFVGLPHRLERVGEYDGIVLVNDSKATNPESAITALESMENIYWIVGGLAKAEGVEPCLNHLQNVRAAFVIGEERQAFEEALAPHVATFDCGTLEKAVAQAFSAAKREGLAQATVLLAPACASFDQFSSFEHRGDVFVNVVKTLLERGGQ